MIFINIKSTLVLFLSLLSISLLMTSCFNSSKKTEVVTKEESKSDVCILVMLFLFLASGKYY